MHGVVPAYTYVCALMATFSTCLLLRRPLMAATVARRSIGVGGSVSMSYMRGFACIHVVLSMRLQDDANRRGEKTQFAVHCWPWRPCAEDDAVTSLSCILVDADVLAT